MPELPEVETVAAGVNERIRGERIESVWLSNKKEPFKTPPGEMAEGLKGRSIEQVHRVGKHIVVDLSAHKGTIRSGKAASGDPAEWIVHLGMTGRLLVCAADVPVPPHTHAQLGLSSGRELRFVDARRFGRLAFHLLPSQPLGPPGKEAPARPRREGLGRFTGPGTEPLTISKEDLIALFRGRRLPIKSALLNQKLLHGVGNIYADESLFRAGIRPRRPAGRLTRSELGRLHSSVQAVLREAIRLGGSSVSDYVDAEGVRGFFQLEHRVYQRGGQPCLVCATAVRRIVVGGRGTHYCPSCQK